MQWIKQAAGSTFVSKSSDGYYAVAKINSDADSVRRFEAFHIEALWAKPEPIGWGSDVAGAQHICDEHRERGPALA